MSAWKKITKTEPEEMRDVLIRGKPFATAEVTMRVGCLLGRTNGPEWDGWPPSYDNPTEWAEIPE